MDPVKRSIGERLDAMPLWLRFIVAFAVLTALVGAGAYVDRATAATACGPHGDISCATTHAKAVKKARAFRHGHNGNSHGLDLFGPHARNLLRHAFARQARRQGVAARSWYDPFVEGVTCALYDAASHLDAARCAGAALGETIKEQTAQATGVGLHCSGKAAFFKIIVRGRMSWVAAGGGAAECLYDTYFDRVWPSVLHGV